MQDSNLMLRPQESSRDQQMFSKLTSNGQDKNMGNDIVTKSPPKLVSTK